MSTAILATKLFIPSPQENIVRRLRLVERLQDLGLTIISLKRM